MLCSNVFPRCSCYENKCWRTYYFLTMALSIKGASVFASYLISIIGVAWSNADKSKAFPAKIMTEWLLILLSCTLFSPRLNREALAAWSVTISSCAPVNCRGIWWCPSLHAADGVSARRGHALFWELWSITKCFLPCAVFRKTILIAQKKQAVLKSCVVCWVFLILSCNMQVLEYAQRVQEKTCYCHFPYKSHRSFEVV